MAFPSPPLPCLRKFDDGRIRKLSGRVFLLFLFLLKENTASSPSRAGRKYSLISHRNGLFLPASFCTFAHCCFLPPVCEGANENILFCLKLSCPLHLFFFENSNGPIGRKKQGGKNLEKKEIRLPLLPSPSSVGSAEE